MNNEEKAQQICEKNKRYHVECSSLECYLSAMDMAQWKDEQFKEYLQKCIKWFDSIADMCAELSSGNVSHKSAAIRGMAIRSSEYLQKQLK